MEVRTRAAEVLLIEDNPGDAELINDALQTSTMPTHISLAMDGDQAVAFLNHGAGYESAPRPDLILLDLNLPKRDGFEVLKEIKAHPVLSRIPVVILTSSQAERDIIKSQDLRANAFVSKPVDVDEFLYLIRSTGEFWLTLVSLRS
jgi:chemotaxis family two-component system response regulator Rcp1